MLSLTLAAGINDIRSVSWNIPAQGFAKQVKATEDKKIFVTITDRNNCITKDTAIVKGKACNPPEKCIAIPRNNDGKNETLGPITNRCRITSINFRIYNRWGELVFESNSPGSGWNGNYRGKPQRSAVYVFVCNYTAEDGISRQQKGTITLMR